MKSITLLFYTLIVYTASSQTTIPLTPTKDASVGFHDGYDSDDTNYGDASHFSAFSQPSASGIGENAAWGIMDFDFSSIPAGSTIVAANLKLYAFGTGFSLDLPYGHDGENSSYLSRITSSWDEYSVTWNTKPDFTTLNQITLPESISPDEDYTDLNVTALIQDIIDDPTGSFGLCLRLVDETPTAGLLFASTDFGDESKFQKLSVTYAGPNVVAQETNCFTITYYPNPTSNFIFVNFIFQSSSNLSLTLTNELGEEVFSEQYANLPSGKNELEINLDHLNIKAGIYYLHCFTHEQMETIPIIFSN